MIREVKPGDIPDVLTIWLEASIKAHHFVKPEFWRSQREAMRDIYLPASDVFVHQSGDKAKGFYALYENTIAAIFVEPELQGQGIGTQLIEHAKQQRNQLQLSVYVENDPSYRFYLAKGFSVVQKRVDEHTGRDEYLMSWSIS